MIEIGLGEERIILGTEMPLTSKIHLSPFIPFIVQGINLSIPIYEEKLVNSTRPGFFRV
jgi:hypothetical protein